MWVGPLPRGQKQEGRACCVSCQDHGPVASRGEVPSPRYGHWCGITSQRGTSLQGMDSEGDHTPGLRNEEAPDQGLDAAESAGFVGEPRAGAPNSTGGDWKQGQGRRPQGSHTLHSHILQA